MTQTPPASLLHHPAFRNLSESAKREVEKDIHLLRFRTGQILTDDRTLPAQIHVVLEGSVRLLGKEGEQLSTLQRMGAGTVVGLASLLRAAACEQVSAASDVLTAALSDQQVASLYRKEPSFRHWCDSTLWPAELASLLSALRQKVPRSDGSLRHLLEEALKEAQLVGSDAHTLDEEGVEHGIFLASANVQRGHIGDPVDRSHPPGAAVGPFAIRLISLPWHLIPGSGMSGESPAPPAEGSPLPPEGTAELGPTVGEEVSSLPMATSLALGASPYTRNFRLLRGRGPLQETLACFQMLARMMNLPFRRDAIEKVLLETLRRGQVPNLPLCGQIAAGLGLHVVAAKVPAMMGTRLQIPSLLPWEGGFAVAVASNSTGLTLASPRQGMLKLAPKELQQRFPEGIELLLLDRTTSTPEQTFGPGWFWPALKRYRGVLLQVLLASFVVQLFTLANPLLIQVIIDKVIAQRSLDTLQVLGIALVAVTLLEGLLSSLRTFLFAETTNRIDQRLGAEVIDHLLRLPLNYFDRRPVGELGTRVAELEKIRSFLTGQALTTILDAAFSVIYIVVMALYSWVLTIVALAVLPIQIGLTLLGAPVFRRQFRKAAEANASTQSHLVEVLTGIQTVKAQNVEMVSRWKWQERYSQYIARTFEKTITGTALNETSQVLQKLSQLFVLWIGAGMVLKGELTLGQLIAFRIISGYVTQPLLRLSSIWQSVQELRVSFERLADVINSPQESNEADQAKIPLPAVDGKVKFDSVSFSFQAGGPEVLKNIDLTVEPHTFVGIVGQSGSGKSTLMKLLPRLYSPTKGRILIDGYDIDKIELYSLRRQIGIVPQDPLLFSGTISENIALTQPEASSEDIVQAAKMACAHDFIMELSAGYSTPVGERGGSLSGGQRQRIAIARTLLSKPKLLVLDEATSALDYESERLLCDNLVDSLKECTVFFITHRLNTIRRAHKIAMMHQGAIVELGTHEELMAMRGRYYALFRQQEAV